MRKALCTAALVIGSLLSSSCYVTQDANRQWWACEDYQAANGPLTACTPIAAPF